MSADQEFLERILATMPLTLAEALRRIEVMKKKHGWLEIPASEVESLLGQFWNETAARGVLREVASNLTLLANTGKSKISRDASALA